MSRIYPERTSAVTRRVLVVLVPLSVAIMLVYALLHLCARYGWLLWATWILAGAWAFLSRRPECPAAA